MDSSVKRERHQQRWEASNTSVRRTAISGLLFAAVVFFNVLEPYSKTADRRANLERIEAQQVEVRQRLAAVSNLQLELDRVSKTVADAPWRQHKDQLIERFARRQIQDPQAEADKTIRDIASEVKDDVVAPLETAVTRANVPSELERVPEQIANAVDAWKNEHEGRRWFRTIRTKEATVLELDESVETIQADARRAVANVQAKVVAERERLAAEQKSLAVEFAAEQEDLQNALDAAIPAWARGLISVEQMVLLYPLILMGLAVYLVARGLRGAAHYQAVATIDKWSNEDRSDPVLSSLWTLTWRGSIGTTATLGCYIGVLACIWFLLWQSIITVGSPILPDVLPHLVMAATVLATAVAPLRGRAT